MSPLKNTRRRSTKKSRHTGNTSRSDVSSHELSGPALLEACLLGRIGFVESLLRLGASVHVRTDEGDTPLILAAVQGSCEVLNRLVDAGADLDAQNGHGLTALMEAAFWGNVEVARILVERGADVHVRDRQGRTALDWAVQEDRQEIVGLLDSVMGGAGADGSNGSEPRTSYATGEEHPPDTDGKSHTGRSGTSFMPSASRSPQTTLTDSRGFVPQATLGVPGTNALSGKRGW